MFDNFFCILWLVGGVAAKRSGLASFIDLLPKVDDGMDIGLLGGADMIMIVEGLHD